MNFKDIHLGKLIKTKIDETDFTTEGILKYFKIDDESKLTAMYQAKSLDTEILLKWSKLLNYDFFRLYSQHLIFYNPIENNSLQTKEPIEKSKLPVFKKQLYTKEIVDFVLELVVLNKKKPTEIIKEYGIPKTTLHKWIRKYKKETHIKIDENVA